MHSVDTLVADLRRLGVRPGQLLVVHSGYKSLGAVDGGPAVVARALCAAVEPGGTVLAPTFTTNLIDPDTWPTPPPAAERARLRDELPYFDPATSAPYKMGAVTQALWRAPGAVRSAHPVTSWVAIGPRAVELTADHPLDDPEGVGGPVGRAYRADADVLLLGVEHDANTTIHLAESLLDMPHLTTLPDRYPTRGAGGRREWRPVRKTTKCSDGFIKLDPHVARAGAARRGRIGDATAQLLRSRDIVRLVCALLAAEPTALLCDDVECVHCPTSRAALRDFRGDVTALGLLD